MISSKQINENVFKNNSQLRSVTFLNLIKFKLYDGGRFKNKLYTWLSDN